MRPTHTLELTHFCPVCGQRAPAGGPCERDGAALRAIPEGDSIVGRPVGHYVAVERIGEGGMGAVYRAVHPVIGAQVAIKVLHASGAPTAAQRFVLEAQAVNRIRHPGVVRILDAGELGGGRPYLVMEWLDGISLAEAVSAGPLPLGTACAIAAAVLDSLAAAHAEGIVHRDLKPHNVFLERGGRVVVLDFGIAKDVGGAGAPSLTRSGVLVGTPAYMAPEQIEQAPIDGRTDVYAMAVVLYELVTGARPFASVATFDLLCQQLEGQARSVRAWNEALPEALDRLLAQGMAKAPAQRFASAAEMAAAVRAVGRGQPDEGVAALVAARRGAAVGGTDGEATMAATGAASPTAPTVQAKPLAPQPLVAESVTPGDAARWRVPETAPPLAGTPSPAGAAVPAVAPRSGPRRRSSAVVVAAIAIAAGVAVALIAARALGPSGAPRPADVGSALAASEVIAPDAALASVAPDAAAADAAAAIAAVPAPVPPAPEPTRAARLATAPRTTTPPSSSAPAPAPASGDATVAAATADAAGAVMRTNEDGERVRCRGTGLTEECEDPDGSEWRTNARGERVRCTGRACFAHFNILRLPDGQPAAQPLPPAARLPGHGQRAFRADHWRPEAERIARTLAPDAVLTRLMTTIRAGGISTTGQGTYELRSPSHPGIAIRVIAGHDAVEVLAISDDGPARPYVRAPRCALDALWARATRELWPQLSSQLSTLYVDYHGGAWDAGDPGDRRVLKDHCPPR